MRQNVLKLARFLMVAGLSLIALANLRDAIFFFSNYGWTSDVAIGDITFICMTVGLSFLLFIRNRQIRLGAKYLFIIGLVGNIYSIASELVYLVTQYGWDGNQILTDTGEVLAKTGLVIFLAFVAW